MFRLNNLVRDQILFAGGPWRATANLVPGPVFTMLYFLYSPVQVYPCVEGIHIVVQHMTVCVQTGRVGNVDILKASIGGAVPCHRGRSTGVR